MIMTKNSKVLLGNDEEEGKKCSKLVHLRFVNEVRGLCFILC